MKKFLSIVLAVVFVFSMATVAFAEEGVSYTYTCDRCQGVMTDSAVYTAHIHADVCATCPHCKFGFATAEEVEAHKGDCRLFTGTCDYCGESVTTENDFNAHVEVCKAKYFNIPLYKITSAIEDFFRTTNWNDIINKIVDAFDTVAGFIGDAIPTIQEFIGKI